MYITFNEQIWFESFVNHQKAARLTCRNMLLLLKQRNCLARKNKLSDGLSPNTCLTLNMPMILGGISNANPPLLLVKGSKKITPSNTQPITKRSVSGNFGRQFSEFGQSNPRWCGENTPPVLMVKSPYWWLNHLKSLVMVKSHENIHLYPWNSAIYIQIPRKR